MYKLFLISLGCLLAYSCAFAKHESDIRLGEQVYVQCTGCHAPDYHRTGPMHCGLIGRRAGSITDFQFSDAMKNSNIVWTEASLDQFLQAPLEVVPGTSMGFVGIDSNTERVQLIAYLKSLDLNHESCR